MYIRGRGEGELDAPGCADLVIRPSSVNFCNHQLVSSVQSSTFKSAYFESVHPAARLVESVHEMHGRQILGLRPLTRTRLKS